MNAHINYDLAQSLPAVIPSPDFDDPGLLADRHANHEHIDQVLVARVVADLMAPGQVVLKLAVKGFGVRLPGARPSGGGAVDSAAKPSGACATHAPMLLRMRTRMIQIRHVPEDVHRRLKERAKREGMSLSDYLLQEVTVLSEQLSWEELFEEIDRDGPALTEDVDTVELIRQGREERERELEARTLRDVPPK